MNSINVLQNTECYSSSVQTSPYSSRTEFQNVPNALTTKVDVCNNLQMTETATANTVQFDTPKLQEHYVWEVHAHSPSVTPATSVLNSPDVNMDMQYPLHPPQTRIQQVHVGRSPGSQFEHHNILSQGLTSPDSPTDIGNAGSQCLHDGEIVLFDDIETGWVNKYNNDCSNIETSPSSKMHSILHGNEDVLKVTKMIGQLPITEYEGSPRRFGNHSLKKSTLSKKPPGFPQRVSSHSNLTQQQLQHQQQQEAAHARHQQMQKQHQFYAQATCSGSIMVTNANSPKSISGKTYNYSALTDLIDIDTDENVTKSSNNVDIVNSQTKMPPLDFLYEFSETRKVLEEFFKANTDEKHISEFVDSIDNVHNYINSSEFDEYNSNRNSTHNDKAYIGQRLARIPKDELFMVHQSPKKQQYKYKHQQICDNICRDKNDVELYIDSNSQSSCDLIDTELDTELRRHSRNFTLSPETTDFDSNCGDLDSLSNDINCTSDVKLCTSMPVLEDGLSSGHTSDTENNCQTKCSINNEAVTQFQQYNNTIQQSVIEENNYNSLEAEKTHKEIPNRETLVDLESATESIDLTTKRTFQYSVSAQLVNEKCIDLKFVDEQEDLNLKDMNCKNKNHSSQQSPLAPSSCTIKHSEEQRSKATGKTNTIDVQEAMKEIKCAIQRARNQPEKLKICDEVLPPGPESPIWIPRTTQKNTSDVSIPNENSDNALETIIHFDEEERDTDLETDRLLGQVDDDCETCEEKNMWSKNARINSNDQSTTSTSEATIFTPHSMQSSSILRQGIGTSASTNSLENCSNNKHSNVITSPKKALCSRSPTSSTKSIKQDDLIVSSDSKGKARNKEAFLDNSVLIEGVLFRARYLGSTQLVCEGQPTKSTRMMQAEEAVLRIKAPEGENQPSTEVDLFISTEKIMVLNTDLKEIMMDHSLRTISYIADIGDLVVLMARRRFVHTDTCTAGTGINTSTNTDPSPAFNTNSNGITDCDRDRATDVKETDCKEKDCINSTNKYNRTPKMICHVFESDEAQFIAQSIGQAFQVAYMEFLKANGIENENLAKEMDYQEVLNSQEIFGDELEIFAKKELQKEVVVPKAKGEILGVVIVESGWGSMLPTVVIANLMPGGAAARCGQLNIGDQLIAINGLSLVGLPLSTCQNYIRNTKNQTAVKFTVVPCPPVVEVKILRPKALFQLGFSVQNGVICSLLRGGIAERGGVRVGHRIIEINNQSVVAVPHDTIVKLLSSSVGEILMKTMPTSMFRLLTGQETPIYI